MNNSTIPNQEFVYVIHATGTSLIKLGYSTNPQKRLSELQTASPHKLQILASWPGNRAREKRLHRHMAQFRREGEWFEVPPFCGLKLWEIATQGEVTAEIEAPRQPAGKGKRKIAARLKRGTSKGNRKTLALKQILPSLISGSWEPDVYNYGFRIKLRWKIKGRCYCFYFRHRFEHSELERIYELSYKEQLAEISKLIIEELQERERPDLIERLQI